MVVETKFCVDCKHYVEDGMFNLCTQGRGEAIGINLVTGEDIKRRSRLAIFVRDKEERCKPEGLLFEPKEDITVQYSPSFFATIRLWFTNKE